MQNALLFMLVVSSPALAEPDSHGTEHHEAGGHDEGGHGDDHGGGHGGGHHHYEYTADADHDGTPNWMDSDEAESPLFNLAAHGFNVILLFGILFWFGRRPIADALANRALNIRKEITDSARVRDEARQRNEELAARLDKIESEISGMRTEAEQEAAKAEAALVTRAHAEAARIGETAERSIRDETQRARAALKRDAVALAVELAESALKEQVNADHQAALAREFLDSLKNGGENRV